MLCGRRRAAEDDPLRHAHREHAARSDQVRAQVVLVLREARLELGWLQHPGARGDEDAGEGREGDSGDDVRVERERAKHKRRLHEGGQARVRLELDVETRPSDDGRDRHAREGGSGHVGDALPNELLVGVVLVRGRPQTVESRAREERLSTRHRVDQQDSPAERGQRLGRRQGRHAEREGREATRQRADGRRAEPEKLRGSRGSADGDERRRDLRVELWCGVHGAHHAQREREGRGVGAADAGGDGLHHLDGVQAGGYGQVERLWQLAGQDHDADAGREARDDALRHVLGDAASANNAHRQLQPAAREGDEGERAETMCLHRLADQQADRRGRARDGERRAAHQPARHARHRCANKPHLGRNSACNRNGQRQRHRDAADCYARRHVGHECRRRNHLFPLGNELLSSEVKDEASVFLFLRGRGRGGSAAGLRERIWLARDRLADGGAESHDARLPRRSAAPSVAQVAQHHESTLGAHDW
mmetsp:Transcript_14192/g.46975  ORF Transcript_14192/g.46975 Transcript_14192/m.46975 type:complete len:478 (+) Transcript_14192:380-1813(+)